MTYATTEASRALSKPISLYFFRYGDGPDDYHAYTDGERPVSFTFDADLGPVIFEAIPISRRSISVSGTLDKASLQIRTPRNAELALMFMDHPPSQVVTLTLWEGHVDKQEFVLAWSGRLISHEGEGEEATYACEPVSTSLKRPGLTRNYQIHCPLVLYGGECRADRTAATITRNPAAVDGPLLTLAPSWETSERKPKYVGGMATWVRSDGRTEVRSIVRQQSDDVLILSGTASGLTAGMVVQLILGCNHDLDDCENLHNNILNYGGQWLIPTDNPFGIKNNFY